MLSDCHAINNTGRFRDFANGERSMSMEMYGYGNSEISFNDNIFIGDLVSYNDMECIEIEIGDMYHRFNTAQREYDQSQLEKKRYNFTVHEVMGNDFDNGGNNVISYTNTNHQENILPEGYCYKAHYKVRLGEFGPVRQGSHRTVIVQSAQPIHAGEILIKVICSFKHNLYGGNELYICDDINRIWYKSMVRDIIDDYTVLINPISNTETPYINWITTSEMLSAGTLKLRKKNYDIPDYAANILTNTFVWRDRLPNGDINNDVTKGMPFASGCFYIDTIVNFHLLRQDPFGYSGLRDIDTSQFYIGVHGEEYKKSAAFFVGNEKIVC